MLNEVETNQKRLIDEEAQKARLYLKKGDKR
jgi:hypothetical protein